jgi:Zn-dependent membrane protease YugP
MTTELKIILIVAVVLIVLLAIVLSSRSRIKKIFKKYLEVDNKHDLTGAQFASASLQYLNLEEVKLAVKDGELIDAYYPKQRTLLMSRDVCDKASIASIAIVAHELGHAVQHKEGTPLYFICALFGKLAKFFNKFFIPLIIASVVMMIVKAPDLSIGLILLYVALGIFGFNFLTKILNIPLEYDASKRALRYLKEYNFVTSSEYGRAKKLLGVAAQTYIASLFDGLIIFGNKISRIFYNKL